MKEKKKKYTQLEAIETIKIIYDRLKGLKKNVKMICELWIVIHDQDMRIDIRYNVNSSTIKLEKLLLV